eukprot:gene15495-biopygen23719
MWDVDVDVPAWIRDLVGSFVSLLPQLPGTPMSPEPADLVLSTDASDDAVGGTLRRWSEGVHWTLRHVLSAHERSLHINLKEVEGVNKGIQLILGLRSGGELPDRDLRVYARVDNTVTLFSLRGGSSSAEIQLAIGKLLLTTLSEGVRIVAVQYVPSAAHVGPDLLSRLKGAESWAIRPAAFSALRLEITRAGLPFPTLEASVRGSPILPRYCARWADPHATCWDFFSQRFAGEILWVNPLPSALAAAGGGVGTVDGRVARRRGPEPDTGSSGDPASAGGAGYVPSHEDLPAALELLVKKSTRKSKLSKVLAREPRERLSATEAYRRILQTAVARHKPGTRAQYDYGRRLALRWMNAEGISSMTFRDFCNLAWDLEEAGYCGSVFRCVHNSVMETTAIAGKKPFYWESSGFRFWYLGQSARMDRNLDAAGGRRGPHAPICRTKWEQLLRHADREADAKPLSRLLLLQFPLYLRVGEASSLKNADIKFGANGDPCGALITASRPSPASSAAFDIRPKGAKHPGGKEWAAVPDELAIRALRTVAAMPERCSSEKRFNAFIGQVARSENWEPGWWASHGLRHGRVRDRLRHLVPPAQIMAEGRWRSRAAFEVYLS